MVSEMAREDIEQMWADGLHPSVADIIRLNALGLKCELSRGAAEYFTLPRVAFLGKLTFREPTIGHNLWIDKVMRFCDEYDLPTIKAVTAFALSRSLDKLPDADDREAVKEAVGKFSAEDLRPFTFAQLCCALTYAECGASAIAKEYPEFDDDETKSEDDVAESIGAGVMLDLLTMGLGLSVREIAHMPLSKARLLQEAGAKRNNIDLAKAAHNAGLGNYYTTRNAIRERLEGEAKQMKEGSTNG